MADISDIPNPWLAPDIDISSSDERSDEALAGQDGDSRGSPSRAACTTKPSSTRVGSERTSSSETDDIGELLRYARQPQQNRFPDGFDPHAFCAALEEKIAELDPVPLFLRKAG